MGTSVRVTPLCGVYNENPLSYLVSIDGFNFLVDCGWNDHFDPSHLQPLARVASTIDAVLLSHADTLHLGALPYAMKRLGLSSPHFGKGEGIVIAPHVAGHLLGGTIWKITKDGSFVRPAVLITDAYNALNNQPYRRQNDKEFGDILKKTLRAGGNVLLPVDTVGRVLELILMLELYWADENLNCPIYFLTYVASSTIDYVKSFLEWMSDTIAKSFEKTPSMASLEAGFSHDIFVEWANDVKNLVLFTERGQFATLARMLQADPPPKAVKVVVSKCVPLVGEELIAYEEEQNRIKKEALKASLMKEEELKTSHGADNDTSDPMVIDSGNNHVPPEVTGPRGGGYRDIFVDGFVPPSTSVAPIFPCYENTSEWDDFGEVINPDDYVIRDEDMDQ
ncbi:Cleavage and polyadenylation specificity factor subunit 2 [Glycine max]|nr:Cleavage and polyadenylation specificity factor subunit 2 [Glycine max]